MAQSYEVVVDEVVSGFFQHGLARSLEAAGFEQVVSLRSPTVPRVRQFRRSPHLLTLTISPESGGRERLTLSSESLSLDSHIAAAVTEIAAELLATFVEPLTLHSRMEVEQTLSQRLRELVDSQIRGIRL